MEISFTVPSVPVAQPRQRHAIIAGHVRNYTPTKSPVNAFKAAVQLAFHQAYVPTAPLEGPLALSCVFVMPRPKRLVWKKRDMPRQPHTGKPDLDNLAKSVKDALKGLAYRDDSQIAAYAEPFAKVIASGYEQPHVEVRIIERSEQPTQEE